MEFKAFKNFLTVILNGIERLERTKQQLIDYDWGDKKEKEEKIGEIISFLNELSAPCIMCKHVLEEENVCIDCMGFKFNNFKIGA